MHKVFCFNVLFPNGFSPFALHFGSGLRQDSFLRVVHFAELVEVNVRSLDDLDFSDLDVLDWIDRADLLGDFLLNDFTGEEVKDLSCVGLRDFLGNDFVDFSADNFLLGAKGIIGLALLVV